MPLSVVDLYRDILPKTNCGDCNFPTCMAFASMVVSEKLPLGNCPHLEPDVITKCQQELDEQYAAGKWLKRDMAQDALEYAKSRAASMALEDLPDRIGGRLVKTGDNPVFELPYFDEFVKSPTTVIPANAGIQKYLNLLDSGFRRNDDKTGNRTFYEFIIF